MRVAIALAAMTVAVLAAGRAAAASVEIRDAAAQVTVVPEDRADVRVEFLTRDPRLPFKVKQGRRTIVDGGLKGSRIRSCHGSGASAIVSVAGVGELPLAALPRIVVHTPRNVEVTAGGAVYGSIGRAANAALGNAGCGDWTIANVDQELKIALAGSGDARAGGSAFAKLRAAGSGDIAIGEVRGPADIDVAGSRRVTVRSVSGELDVHVAGSADVTVEAGRATPMTATIAGSGNVTFRGVADSLDARVTGSGDIRVGQVRGVVKKRVMGSGRVIIG
jgi:hypothetical protein